MLAFATEFPIGADVRAPAFIATVRRWVLRSPHTSLSEADLAPLAHEAEWRFSARGETVDLLRCDAGGVSSVGMRYTRDERGAQWQTSLVFDESAGPPWVAVRVDVAIANPQVRVPPVKKPVVVRTLLEELGGGEDGLLTVSRTPHMVAPVDVGLVADLMQGRGERHLPVVYISRRYDGDLFIDPDRLAHDLGGMAHVIVEPDRPFSHRLAIDAERTNAYGGALGVYWPDGGGRRMIFLGNQYQSAGDVVRAVIDEVRDGLVARRPMPRCTWAAVERRASSVALEILRQKGSRELNEYVAAFDRDLALKDEALAEAEREIRRLKDRVATLEARQSTQGNLTLSTGAEQDFYPHEILGHVLSALRDAATRVPEDSRRQHVLRAILDAAPVIDGASTRREMLKELLRDERGLSKELRRELEAMGFEITTEGKHVKLRFEGDDRYVFVLSKSASDRRSGLNSASDIGRMLF